MTDLQKECDRYTREARIGLCSMLGRVGGYREKRVDAAIRMIDGLRYAMGLELLDAQRDGDQLDWDRIQKEQPKVLELIRIAKTYEQKPGFCRSYAWKGPGGLEEKLQKIVGPKSGASSSRWIRTQRAYKAASRAVLQNLPRCGHDPGLGCA